MHIEKLPLLLKSSGLTFESWNAIICTKSIHRASLYCNLWNLVKEMIRHVTWLLLLIQFKGSSQLGSHLTNILFTSLILSILIIHSVIVIYFPLTPYFGSLTCANTGMVEHAARSCHALDWSSIIAEFMLLLLQALHQDSVDTDLDQLSIHQLRSTTSHSESTLTLLNLPWNRCIKQI